MNIEFLSYLLVVAALFATGVIVVSRLIVIPLVQKERAREKQVDDLAALASLLTNRPEVDQSQVSEPLLSYEGTSKKEISKEDLARLNLALVRLQSESLDAQTRLLVKLLRESKIDPALKGAEMAHYLVRFLEIFSEIKNKASVKRKSAL